MSKEIKKEIINEIFDLFNEVYSGVNYPPIAFGRIKYFLTRALNKYENKLEALRRKTE